MRQSKSRIETIFNFPFTVTNNFVCSKRWHSKKGEHVDTEEKWSREMGVVLKESSRAGDAIRANSNLGRWFLSEGTQNPRAQKKTSNMMQKRRANLR